VGRLEKFDFWGRDSNKKNFYVQVLVFRKREQISNAKKITYTRTLTHAFTHMNCQKKNFFVSIFSIFFWRKKFYTKTSSVIFLFLFIYLPEEDVAGEGGRMLYVSSAKSRRRRRE